MSIVPRLSPTQFLLTQAFVQTLPVEAYEAFFDAMFQELIGRPHPTDADVTRACEKVRQQFQPRPN